MSTWREIKKQEDVELSEDGKTLEVLYMSDYNGNNYIDIPIEFARQALPPQTDDKYQKLIDDFNEAIHKLEALEHIYKKMTTTSVIEILKRAKGRTEQALTNKA